MCVAEEKQSLRKKTLAWRQSLDSGTKRLWDEQILQKLLSLPAVQNCQHLLTYVSTEEEIDTRTLVEWAWGQNKVVGVPLCKKGGVMDFYPIDGWDKLHRSRFGILEPSAWGNPLTPNHKTVMVVPAFSIDEQGYRLGYGGGYYDRYLGQYAEAFSVGLVYERQRTVRLPKDVFDVPVKIVVTETHLYEYF